MPSDKEIETYEHFRSYNFLDNKQFVEGWTAIERKLPQEGNTAQEKLLQAKIFFFSKFYHPISLESYKQWLQQKVEDIDFISDTPETVTDKTSASEFSSQNATCSADTCDPTKSYHNTEPNENPDITIPTQTSDVESEDRDVLSANSRMRDLRVADEEVENLENLASSSCELRKETQDAKQSLSFGQIMELIEKGLPIPGVEELKGRPAL